MGSVGKGSDMGNKSSKGDRLTKEDLEFLRTHTRYDEGTITEWYRGFKQDCPDGRLTPAAFVKIYSKCFPSGNAGEFTDHVFRTFDSDKNGFIDFKEFLMAIDVTSSGSPEEKLNWAFSMYDVDGNGYIDLMEMTRIVKSIYQVMRAQAASGEKMGDRMKGSAESRAESIFKKMDRNSDGRVTREEFVRTCLGDQHLLELLTPHSQACHIQ